MHLPELNIPIVAWTARRNKPLLFRIDILIDGPAAVRGA